MQHNETQQRSSSQSNSLTNPTRVVSRLAQKATTAQDEHSSAKAKLRDMMAALREQHPELDELIEREETLRFLADGAVVELEDYAIEHDVSGTFGDIKVKVTNRTRRTVNTKQLINLFGSREQAFASGVLRTTVSLPRLDTLVKDGILDGMDVKDVTTTKKSKSTCKVTRLDD